MATSKKPKVEENEKKKKKSNSSPVKETKKPIKKPDKKPGTTKKPNKSKPKPKLKSEPDKKKSSNGNLVESEVIADPASSNESNEQENEKKTDKNVKPNKRKQKEKVAETEKEEDDEEKMCRFPMNRIKRIIKSEDSRMAVSQDVVFLVNKASEIFLEKFCEDGYKCCMKDHKKSLSYKHLSSVVHNQSKYDFLSDYVPQKTKTEDALKARNMTETGQG